LAEGAKPVKPHLFQMISDVGWANDGIIWIGVFVNPGLVLSV
jgi:hypothetical protein